MILPFETIANQAGTPDVRSWLYADAYLRYEPVIRRLPPPMPLPSARFWYREPGLWLPLSCAIGFDTSQQDNNVTGGGAGPSTFSFAPTGSNLIQFTSFRVNASATLSAASYNSIAGTLIDSDVAVDDGTVTVYLYMWVGPAAGAHNYSVTLSGSARIDAFTSSYANAAQSAQPDAKTTGGTTASGDPATVSLTTVANNCWIVGYACNLTNSAITANTNVAIRQTFAGPNSVHFDTNSAQTPAGSKSMIFNNSGGFSLQSLMASFAPFGASAPIIPNQPISSARPFPYAAGTQIRRR